MRQLLDASWHPHDHHNGINNEGVYSRRASYWHSANSQCVTSEANWQRRRRGSALLHQQQQQQQQQTHPDGPELLKCHFYGIWASWDRQHLQQLKMCEKFLEFLFHNFLIIYRQICLKITITRRSHHTTTHHYRWQSRLDQHDVTYLSIIQGHDANNLAINSSVIAGSCFTEPLAGTTAGVPVNPGQCRHHQQHHQQQLRQRQKQQQQQSTMSSCRSHGTEEDWRRHYAALQLHQQQLIGFCCPFWASSSRKIHIQPDEQLRRRHQLRPYWPIWQATPWPRRRSQVYMGAPAVLLLMATSHLMLISGVSNPYSASLPPLPWPGQRQQQIHQQREEEEELQRQQRWTATATTTNNWRPSHGDWQRRVHRKAVRTRRHQD
ncbi:hypothetical protein ACLKA6_004500 [Drosophila palustris]